MNETRTYEELRRHLDTLAEDLTGKPDKTAIEQKKARAYNTAFWETMHTGMPSAALKEGSDGSGGYLVPDTYEDTLVEALKDKNVLRRLGHTIHTTKNLKLPVNLGGGSAGWVTEGEEIPTSDTSFDQVVIRAHKLATSIVLSDELLEDAVSTWRDTYGGSSESGSAGPRRRRSSPAAAPAGPPASSTRLQLASYPSGKATSLWMT